MINAVDQEVQRGVGGRDKSGGAIVWVDAL